MQLDVDVNAGVCRTRLSGEVTIYQAAELRHGLGALVDSHAELEVDLSGVTELDTAGVQLLLFVKRAAAATGRCCRYVQHSEAVIEVLDALNIGRLLGDPIVLARSGG